jgi:hypothetical protein
MGVIGSSDRATSALGAIELNAGSNRVVRIGYKQNSAGAYPTYSTITSALSTEIRRVRLILRKENWDTAGTPNTRNVEFIAYDGSDNVLYTSSGLQHGLDPYLWTTGVKDADAPTTGQARFFLEFAAGTAGPEGVTISQADVIYRGQDFTIDTIWGPFPDWYPFEMPRFQTAEQPYMDHAKIIPSGAPFSADNSGGNASTNTAKLIEAGKNAYEYGMDLFFAAGTEYAVNNQLFYRQLVSQRTSSTPTDRDSFIDESRAFVFQGSNQGVDKPKLRLVNGASGYGNAASPKVFLFIENADYNPEPPAGTSKPNSSYNQVVSNMWLDTGTNVGAIALDMQGAQGQAIVRIKCTGNDTTPGYAGIRNGNGAGGSQYTGDISGYLYGLLVVSCQPGTVFSGFNIDVPSTGISAIYCGPSAPLGWGSETGPRNTALFVGCNITLNTASTGKLAVDGGNMSTSSKSLVEQGYMEFVDCIVDFSNAQTANTAFETNRCFVVERTWVRNCNKILEHPKGDVMSPSSTGWVYIKRLVVPYDLVSPEVGTINANIASELPGTNGVDHELVPNNIPFDTAKWVDGVRSTTNIEEIYADGHALYVAPPSDLTSKHRISDAQYKTWEDATIDVAADYGPLTLDGFTDVTVPMDEAMADSVVGDVIYLRRGHWLRNNTYDLLEGRHLVGSGKMATAIIPSRFPTANQPFGSNDNPQRPVLRTADSTFPSTVGFLNVWRHHGMPKGFGIHFRGNDTSYEMLCRRNELWGFTNYSGTPQYDASTALILWSGKASGKHFIHNQGVIFNTVPPYCHYEFRDIEGEVSAYAINPEHTHGWPGNLHIINCNRVNIYGSKCEANAPFVNAVDSNFVALHALTGNSSGHIPRANVPVGENVNSPSSTRGYNPAPVGFYPSPYDPALVYMRNVANFRISQVQDEGRFQSSEFHQVFGGGTRPDYWHFGVEGGTNTQTWLMPTWDRPVYWAKGDMDGPDPPPGGSILTIIQNYFRRRKWL